MDHLFSDSLIELTNLSVTFLSVSRKPLAPARWLSPSFGCLSHR